MNLKKLMVEVTGFAPVSSSFTCRQVQAQCRFITGNYVKRHKIAIPVVSGSRLVPETRTIPSSMNGVPVSYRALPAGTALAIKRRLEQSSAEQKPREL